MLEWLTNTYRGIVEHPFANGVVPHLLTVAGFLLAFFAIARQCNGRPRRASPAFSISP